MQIIAIKLILNGLGDILFDLRMDVPAKTCFRASLPKSGKDEFGSRRACPNRARVNLISGELAQIGQG
jgi:hypothetical protein